MFSVLFSVYLRVELLSHVIILFNILRNGQVVFQSDLPPAKQEGSDFSYY
jgi:hypothetical protein